MKHTPEVRQVQGIEPNPPHNPRRLGLVTNGVLADLRRQRLIRKLHDLGPRPVLEAMLEVESGARLDQVLERFGRLNPDTVRALGGNEFPPSPIHAVRR